jgi:hypothetical protein
MKKRLGPETAAEKRARLTQDLATAALGQHGSQASAVKLRNQTRSAEDR